MAIGTSPRDASEAQIRAQLDRMLTSKLFKMSRRQRDFLNHVVDSSLEGRADRLKEFSLGIDVFERDDSFDPSVDSIVRVEASRLRGKIREYYGGDGADDPVVIEIPKGHYVPTFRLADAANRDRRQKYRAVIYVAIAAAAIAGWSMYSQRADAPRDVEQAAVDRTAIAPQSVAVLPLRDRSNVPEDYFSEAMTDAIISSLAKTGALRVTSMASGMQFRDSDMPMSSIGNALGVAYLVEGSIYRNEENVRITAQLISTNNDEQVWSTTFDRPASDLVLIQNEIATAIADQISGKLTPQGSVGTELNPAAYEAYLKGRYFFNQFTADGYRRGMRFFQDAIDIEPRYANAYAGLASCHCLLAGHGLEMISPIISIPQAQSYAMRAQELDPELAEPLAFLGIIDFKFNWDPASAEARLLEAIGMNPSLYHAYVWHSQILEAMGRHDEAVDQARYAKRLNPLSLAASLNLGWQLYQAGMYIEASAEIDDLIDFDPGFWGGYWVRGHIHNRHHMYNKAIIEFRQAVELGGGHSLPMSALGYTFAVAGKRDEARQIIANLDRMSRDNYVSPVHVATVYAGLNERDQLYEWLERAYAVRARSLAWIQVTHEFVPFRGDKRFRDLVERIGIVSDKVSNQQANTDL